MNEQDLAHALWMLEKQINSAHDLIKFWAVFKKRQVECPDIEKFPEKTWFSRIID